MKFLGEGVRKASETVVKILGENEGLGGVIALDEQGNCEPFHKGLGSWPFVLK